MIRFKKKNAEKIKTIEYLGLPATGKTTSLELMHSENNRMFNVNKSYSSYFIVRQFKKINHTINYFFKKPRGFSKDLKEIILSNPKKTNVFIASILNWYLINWSFLTINDKNNDNDIFAWDQGLFQGLWTILYNSNDPEDVNLQELIKDKNLPDEVVYLDEPDNILKDRLENRGTKIILDYTDEMQVKQARQSMDLLISIIDQNYIKVED